MMFGQPIEVLLVELELLSKKLSYCVTPNSNMHKLGSYTHCTLDIYYHGDTRQELIIFSVVLIRTQKQSHVFL